MMVVVGHLRLSGAFEELTAWTLARLRTPRALLAGIVGLAGLLSAFFVNDVVCLVLTPLVLRCTRRLRLPPVPYLIGLATAANIGSAATLTGNPQNMIIGSLSHVSYVRFAAGLAPVAVLGLLVDLGVLTAVYRRTLAAIPPDRTVRAPADPTEPQARTGSASETALRRVRGRSVAVAFAAVVLFFLGLPTALVALGAAAVLLLIGARPDEVYEQIDWSLLVMFAGIFVVVHSFGQHVVARWDLTSWQPLARAPLVVLTLLATGLSNLVSNVPAVLLFRPLVPLLAKPDTAWLVLAMSSTFAGNLTLLGSVANLIVAEGARREGVELSFTEYCRVGIPVTVLTLVLGTGWLSLLAR
jgi:Na+/H+ antiporter NhaD/arsenite permease-like protein